MTYYTYNKVKMWGQKKNGMDYNIIMYPSFEYFLGYIFIIFHNVIFYDDRHVIILIIAVLEFYFNLKK